MAKKPETKLQKKIQKALKLKFGGFWFKSHGNQYQQSGLPDLIGCVAGFYFGIEVKMPGEEPDPLQKWTLKQIRKKGGGYATSVETVQEAVDFVELMLARSINRYSVSSGKRLEKLSISPALLSSWSKEQARQSPRSTSSESKAQETSSSSRRSPSLSNGKRKSKRT